MPPRNWRPLCLVQCPKAPLSLEADEDDGQESTRRRSSGKREEMRRSRNNPFIFRQQEALGASLGEQTELAEAAEKACDRAYEAATSSLLLQKLGLQGLNFYPWITGDVRLLARGRPLVGCG